jgi:hypothetical protein
MRRVAEEHKQAARAGLLLRQLLAETRGRTPEERRDLTQQLCKLIEELLVSEILKAVHRNWIEAGLCGVYIGVAHEPPYTIVRIMRENPEIIYAGIRDAAASVAVSGAQFHEHVEACVAKNILKTSTLVERITVSRTEDGRTKVDIAYRFAPPVQVASGVTDNMTFEILSGDTPIAEALERV